MPIEKIDKVKNLIQCSRVAVSEYTLVIAGQIMGLSEEAYLLATKSLKDGNLFAELVYKVLGDIFMEVGKLAGRAGMKLAD